MASLEHQEGKGYMSDYKKLIFCEHEVTTFVLESQHHIELELSRFDNRLEDVDMHVRVLVFKVEYVNNMLHRM